LDAGFHRLVYAGIHRFDLLTVFCGELNSKISKPEACSFVSAVIYLRFEDNVRVGQD
jgi:hypothetical protein